MSHVPFPPPSGPLLVPTTGRGAAKAGLALWSATRPRARALQRGLSMACDLLGPRALPGRRMAWSYPTSEAVLRAHQSAWNRWFGPHDDVAVYRPSQTHRTGMALLLVSGGSPTGFVKFRRDWDPRTEVEAMGRLEHAQTFVSPKVVGVHDGGGWTSVGFAALPPRIHSPRVGPVRSIVEEVSELTSLGGAVPPSPGWRPMHGDMGPWNLRTMPGIGPVLFDWEHVAYAPPYADLVFHAAASAAVGLGVSGSLSDHGEAVAFWQNEIPRRFGGERRDARLAGEMLRALLRLG